MRIRTLGASLVLFAQALYAGLAYAQSSTITSPADLLSATGAGDKATSFFEHLLGAFYRSPLTYFGGDGGGVSLIGQMFLIFNAALFAVAVLWVGYQIVGSIAETAQKGQVLGQRFSPVWMPIRLVTGISGVAPVFGGFSLSQVLLVSMTALGIGIGNAMWSGAVTATEKFVSLSPPSVLASSSGGIDFSAAAHSAFAMNVCQLATKESEVARQNVGAATIEPIQMRTTAQADLRAVQWGPESRKKLCGAVQVRRTWDEGREEGRSSSSVFGFRVASVNYDAFAATVANAYMGGFDSFNSSVESIARQWLAARAQGGAMPAYPSEALERAAATWAGQVSTALASNEANAKALNSSGSALVAQARNNMLADGWVSAGAWSSTFAEVNAALADAMKAVSFTSVEPDLAEIQDSIVAEALGAIPKGRAASGDLTDGGGSISDTGSFSAVNNWLCGVVFGTQTGNCSVGQAIVRKSIDAAAMGSGGGEALINPIIMFKNMGDNLLVATQAIGAALFAVEHWSGDTGSPGTVASAGGVLQKGVELAGNVPIVGKLVKGISNVVLAAIKEAFVALKMAMPFMLILGLAMAIYIPMIPFITWMGGVVQYAVIVCMGLVGMPIAAMSHLDAEGEGMGRRTEAGYMLLLNVTFRPALMLFGFFLASALMIVIGSFQAKLFLGAMASAQGNSVTGLLSVIAYLTLFFVLNFTLIQGLYNMIFLIPDQVLGLIGNGGNMEAMGKEVEGKMHGFFMAYGRQVQGAVEGSNARRAQGARDKLLQTGMKSPGVQPRGGDPTS